MFFGLLTIALVGLSYCSENQVRWGYKKGHGLTPKEWGTKYPKCNGKRQSPINIVERSAKFNRSLTPIQLKNYANSSPGVKYTLTNNGHTVSCAVSYSSDVDRKSLVFLNTEFVLDSFHWHWGNNSKRGSEHQVNGKSYPLELHIIHYNTKYGNFSEATKHSDGLLVWGNFYEVDNDLEDFNGHIQRFVGYLKDVRHQGMSKIIPPSFLNRVNPSVISDYYHYEGSLTTPGCDQIVLWIVDREERNIRDSQLEVFRSIMTDSRHTNLVDNFRPVQEINERIVYTSILDLRSAPNDNSATRVINSAFILLLLVAVTTWFIE